MSQENVELVRGLMLAPDVDIAALFRDDDRWSAVVAVVAPILHSDFECTATLLGSETRNYGRGPDGFRAFWLDLDGSVGDVSNRNRGDHRPRRPRPSIRPRVRTPRREYTGGQGVQRRRLDFSATGRSWASTPTQTVPRPLSSRGAGGVGGAAAHRARAPRVGAGDTAVAGEPEGRRPPRPTPSAGCGPRTP